MKILKRGDLGRWPMKFSCAKCKSELEVGIEDLDYDSWKISGYHFDGTAVSAMKYTFDCPVCKSNYEVPEASIPFDKRAAIKSHY